MVITIFVGALVLLTLGILIGVSMDTGRQRAAARELAMERKLRNATSERGGRGRSTYAPT